MTNKNWLFPKSFNSIRVAALMLALASAVVSARASSTTNIVLQQIQTVFVIAMENHNFTQPPSGAYSQQLLGNPAAPYLNSLITPGNSNAAQVSFATRYYNCAVGTHPSEPNYIWAEAGSDFGEHTDSDPYVGNTFNAPHLTSLMNASNISWKNYQEDLEFSGSPLTSAYGTSATAVNPYYGSGQFFYAAKHNPMAFFPDTQKQNVFPLTNLFNDLVSNNVGRYNWITPNLFNDQHSSLNGGFFYHGVGYSSDQAGIAQGDNFLATIIPIIMASPAYQSNGVIILRWDETEGGDGTNYTLPEIIISPLAKGNAYASSVVMNHSSDVKTMSEIFGLAFLTNPIPTNEYAASGSGYNNVATVNDLVDMFQIVTPAPTNTPPSPVVIAPTNTPPVILAGQTIARAFQLTFTGTAGQTYSVLASDTMNTAKSTWAVIGNGTFTTTNAIFADLDATNHSSRYYAIRTP